MVINLNQVNNKYAAQEAKASASQIISDYKSGNVSQESAISQISEVKSNGINQTMNPDYSSTILYSQEELNNLQESHPFLNKVDVSTLSSYDGQEGISLQDLNVLGFYDNMVSGTDIGVRNYENETGDNVVGYDVTGWEADQDLFSTTYKETNTYTFESGLTYNGFTGNSQEESGGVVGGVIDSASDFGTSVITGDLVGAVNSGIDLMENIYIDPALFVADGLTDGLASDTVAVAVELVGMTGFLGPGQTTETEES